MQGNIFWYGYYEKNEIRTLESFLQKNHTVIDIGANIGYYSIMASAKVQSVFAFEPYANLRERLSDNLKLNDINNVHLIDSAVSDQNGTAELFISNGSNIGMTGLSPSENFIGIKESVKTCTLDDWQKNNHTIKPDIIKIDAEGSEGKILKGMKSILEVCKPVLFIEVNGHLLERLGSSVNEIFSYLAKYKYSPYSIISPGILLPLSEPSEGDLILFMPEGYPFPSSVRIMPLKF